jgi:hypothetical protein
VPKLRTGIGIECVDAVVGSRHKENIVGALLGILTLGM